MNLMNLTIHPKHETIRQAVQRRIGLSTLPPAKDVVRAAEAIVKQPR